MSTGAASEPTHRCRQEVGLPIPCLVCGSPWKPGRAQSGISEQLQDLGHEVIVANVRELRAISHSDRKSDQVDAEKLARFARLDPENSQAHCAPHSRHQQEALTLILAPATLSFACGPPR